VLDKCYDRILNNRLTTYLEKHTLLHEAQNAFRPGRSCLEHVLSLHTIMQRRREQGLDTYIFFNDQAQAYDTTWRQAIVLKLAEKGVRGKFLRVAANQLKNTTAMVSQGGVRSRIFSVDQGVEQGGTLSPTLFNVFIDGLLQDVWQHCAGVPIEQANGPAAKLSALMFADDFVGVAASEEELQLLVDRVHAYSRRWRMKANIGKCAVMVVRGKPPRGTAASATARAQTNIRWGGAEGQRIEQVAVYNYMGVALHENCTWDAQLQAATDKTAKKAAALASLLRTRTASAGVKRMAALVLLRPTMEWGAGVWRPNKTDLRRVDSAQADLLKSAFHTPATISHSALLQELGIRPMSLCFDKRLLEEWHRIATMPDERLVKRVVFGAGVGAVQGAGRAGARQRTWRDRVGEAMQEWGVDANRAMQLNYSQLKRLLHKLSYKVAQNRLQVEEADKPALRRYRQEVAAGPLQFKEPQAYLCGHAACTRGKELLLQLRTGALPLASLTGKFGRRRRGDEIEEQNRTACPSCGAPCETAEHLLLECPEYEPARVEFWQCLHQKMPDEDWSTLQNLSGADRVCALSRLDEKLITAVVAPFLYKCWQQRLRRITEDRSAEREADGSDAMA
jgi:hypothetical protein